MALTGTAKTIVDILLVIFLPPLAVFLVRGTACRRLVRPAPKNAS
jgi:uncharacterized membrane protein YqaE (UPF0057 family)